MSKITRLIFSGVIALAGVGAGIANGGPVASVTGSPCTLGTPNCTVVDPDDPSAPGRYTNPNDPVTTTVTNGDTGQTTTTVSPATPSPAPPPAD